MSGGAPRSPRSFSELPSPATLFRMRLYDQASVDLIRDAKEKLKPLLKLRDGGNLKRIQAARTPEELLDLSPLATGLAQEAWHSRMRSLGPQVLPFIRDILHQVQSLDNNEVRHRISALLIAELRWQGEAGAQALQSCLEDLDDEAAALACVALGLINSPTSAKDVWQRYLRLKALTPESHFIGGLWGLIDLGDRRVAGEVFDYLRQKRYFYELFGFLSLAGDQRALGLLITQAMEQGRGDGIDALMAATAIAHRVGKLILVRELLTTAQPDLSEGKIGVRAHADDNAGDEIANMILSRPVQEVHEYFALFYRGFQPQDATVADEFIRQNKG